MRKIKLFGLAAALATFLLMGGVAQAGTYSGQVIKGSGPALYYVTKGNQRLVFPDEATYKTWYPDFRGVIQLSDATINQLPLVGLVAMKPGVRMVKAIGDSHVYAVARYGVKRLISSPSVARIIYGQNWPKSIAEISPATLAEYVPGGLVAGPDQYWWWKEEAAVKTIDDNFEPTLNGMRQVPGATVVETAQITLKAVVINGTDGRTAATDSDVNMYIDALGDQRIVSGKAVAVKPGDYTVYDTDIPGFVISGWSGACNQSGSDSHAGYVHLNAGDKKSCEVTYTYSLAAWTEPTLTVSVNVINNWYGHLIPQDFSLFVGSNFVKTGETRQYAPGSYKLTVSAPPVQSESLYTPMGWSGDCNGDGTIELKRGRGYSCVFTYQDYEPHVLHPTMGQLVLSVSGLSSDLAKTVKLFIEGKQVSVGQLNDIDPRDYTVYASNIAGYRLKWGGDCLEAGTVKGEVNKYKTCVANYTKN